MENYYVNIVSNLDRYNSSHFPTLPVIPRVGEFVSVLPECAAIFTRNSYPAILEVKTVTYYQNFVEVSVHYSDTQLMSLKILNKEL